MANKRFISFLNNMMSTENMDSFENTVTVDSTSTEEVYNRTSVLKVVTLPDGKQIIEDIVNDIFDNRKGLANFSSSSCSEISDFEECTKMDKRLKLWYDTLKDRTKMQEKIQKKLGRRPDQMLFNMPTTVEQRDKGTVKRLIDYADRMNPVALTEKTVGILPSHYDPETCQHVNQLVETLPMPEQKGETTVEISGLTKKTMVEIMGPSFDSNDIRNNLKKNKHNKWLDSKVLEDRIDEKCEDLKRVLDFYPDVENLEIVGINMLESQNILRNNYEMLDNASIYSISSSTKESNDMENMEEQQLIVEMKKEIPELPIKVGIKVNDEIFIHDKNRSASEVCFDINFECEPFQRVLKEVLRLENIGTKMLNCRWQNPEFYKRNPLFLNTINDAFIFDRDSFILLPGQIKVCKVVYQPRSCSLHKQRWDLKIFPIIYCIRRDCLMIRMHGKCVPSREYVEKVNKQITSVIIKSNKNAMDKLTSFHGSLVPLIQPYEVLCPYQRIFDEREIFNTENVGYLCKRFDDLEVLKTLYKDVKKPREPDWDLRLETIKKMILRLPDAEKREKTFKKFRQILDTLIGSIGDGEILQRFDHNSERDRSRFIYVRGCITNGIEEWEDLMINIEQNSLKLELSRFYNRIADEEREDKEREETYREEGSSDDDERKPWMRQLRQDNPNLYVLKKLRGKKYYRDSLYIQTYTHLCDIAENIVSVIESTEYV